MSLGEILLLLVAGAAGVALWGFLCGFTAGRRHVLHGLRVEAEARRRRAFAISAREGSELNYGRYLVATDEVARIDAELDGDEVRARDLRRHAHDMEDHLRRIEAVCN